MSLIDPLYLMPTQGFTRVNNNQKFSSPGYASADYIVSCTFKRARKVVEMLLVTNVFEIVLHWETLIG